MLNYQRVEQSCTWLEMTPTDKGRGRARRPKSSHVWRRRTVVKNAKDLPWKIDKKMDKHGGHV